MLQSSTLEPRRSLPHLSALLMASMLLLAVDAPAADPDPPTYSQTKDAEPIRCIEVEVNGQRIPDYGCFSQMLAGEVAPAEKSDASLPASERIARRPPTELGLANRAATSQRMGNAFGKSTTPQRPPPAVPRPIIPGR
jgi:hypothetical protein